MSVHVDAALDVAERVLAPDAARVDAEGVIPQAHLEAIARAGLYGVAATAGPAEMGLIGEILVSGCLATGFVWAQHHGVLTAVMRAGDDALAEQLVRGTRIAGVSFSGLSSHGHTVRAEPVAGGHRLTGRSVFLTGWGIVDLLGIWAHDPDTGSASMFLIDRPEMLHGADATPLPLIAGQGSNTVAVAWDAVVGGEPIARVLDDHRSPSAAAGIRINAALALGVCRAAIRELVALGASAEAAHAQDQLDALRAEFDAVVEGGTPAGGASEVTTSQAAASDAALYRLRGQGALLALRLAAGVTAVTGSRSVLRGSAAERLLREAQFAAVSANRPAIGDATLRGLSLRTD
ncbi:hypothetical protein GCM10027169_25010 [Gordonia jinhuaensis]|uniref:Acyl-CoA dehydrogenase/oxidase N-terminal domain-containing protein n=1 Tax=Gordonia jinhuaensis TaxID=1517702 RepID=A0A916WY91_9ACTN|nr:acyl-CoA dehydrogenase family protein [Gordonia jinhuaensis]GGB39202.1 hypothetical protein GCM10011489_28610 [Gordonia jinhuaensis]